MGSPTRWSVTTCEKRPTFCLEGNYAVGRGMQGSGGDKESAPRLRPWLLCRVLAIIA